MRKVIFLLFAVLGVFFTMELSAQKIYLNVDGIEGESTVRDFEKQVEADSYSHSAAGCQDVNSTGGSRATGCKVSSSGFQFSMSLSKATNGFRERLYTGKIIPKILISVTRSGGDQRPFAYYTIELTNVRVVSMAESASNGSGLPNIFVEFSPATALWKYYMQTETGSPELTNQFGWDFLKAGAL
jgi:type VI secretion system secreted protein Hcp